MTSFSSNSSAKPGAEGAAVKNSSKDESGSDINPHIPQYISKAPWYLNSTPGLKHQRHRESIKASIDTWHRRGVKSEVAIKYRKGACENCGAITHDSKSCVERPRKKGAKYTNADICPDEYIVKEENLGYDASRDRWAGFDPDSHKVIVDEYQDIEKERAKRKMSKLSGNNGGDDDSSDSDSDGIKMGEFGESDATFGTKDSNTRTTTRNLRIREDTAKYLINLDLDSAFYDPKSRSMRGDPLIGLKNAHQHSFRGDNVYFNSEETYKPKELEVFAWETHKKGVNLHSVANPTELEFMYKKSKDEQKERLEKRRGELIEQYKAGEYLENFKELQHLSKVSSSDIVHSDKRTVEYDEESILGHSQVWGSHYDRENGSWGYKCCLSTERFSKCTA
ncbi:step II splicing factor, putative [Theileria equi strain WA]|uniref:Pre-mRNA-splicing factor SLU7 n=1 Tax=Theileria equi strain WA TaxID=1537102 RepID=L0B150_THEEQ|nr:step II splicing factor, putative [Theileria equi strain WA]AFZ81238.1 step II splicing factor, putative [Theileria equi strain WA]|eukprot:XP_004830904.1 step II splicing factor, putative [Theileria equi strain WA]